MKGLMNTQELGEYLSVSRDYIGARCRENDWKEGTHWVYLNLGRPQAGVRFVPELCLHWILNQAEPDKHQAFIIAFQSQHQLTA